MDEENVENEKKKKSASERVQQGVDTAKQVKQTADKIKHAENARKVASSSKFLTAIGPALPYIGIALLIILLIIFIIGIVVFVITMPGMVMEQLKAMFHELGNKVAAFFGQSTIEQIEPEEIYEVLDYLEDMGYDLKGYGFLTAFFDESDVNSDEWKQAEEDSGETGEADGGVIRGKESGKVIGASSDFILYYIMSDNYIYTVKNYNITNSSANEDGFWHKVWGGIVALGQKIAGLFVDQGALWGEGMIYIITESGTEWTDKDIVDLDASTKLLTIKAPGTNKAFEYSVDGWTGRYGMPLEFLLSVHLATNMPDLAYEMVNQFETQVVIKLKSVTVQVKSYYRDPNTNADILLADLLKECSAWESAEKDIVRVFNLGLTSPEDCEGAVDHKGNDVKCSDIGGTAENDGITEEKYNKLSDEKKEEYRLDSDDGLYYKGNGTACSVCGSYLRQIKEELNDAKLSATNTYVPYISRVENHWFRDVYFELESDRDDIITNDDEYEALMKERWTLYETDENGIEVLYVLDSDGNYTGEKYDGTKEEALEEGVAVAKKAITTDDYKAGWSAYETDESSSASSKEKLYPDEDGIKGQVYVQSIFTNTQVQKEEAIRTETNSTIKDMFSNRYYFKYDGNQETAEIIYQLRQKLGSDSKPHYGELSDEQRDESYEITLDNKEEDTYYVKDYSSRVDLTKDSLSAFSMLENTHTVDADYIYKDFKELIVELGYFEKEDLAENIPEIFQWFIPEIGSGGYPKRAYDKKENMYGTMAHSKGDYEAFAERDIQANYESFVEEVSNGTEAYVFGTTDSVEPDTSLLQGINKGDINNEVSAVKLDSVSSKDIKTVVGNSSSTLKDPSDISVEEFLTKAAEVHARMEGTSGSNRWEYCAAGTHSGDSTRHTSDGNCPGNYATYEAAAANGRTADCSSYVSWVLQEVGLITAKYTSSGMYGALKQYILTKSEAGTLQPGDILLSEGHVQINGENNMQYNAGSTSAIQGQPKEYLPDFYTHVIRLPFSGTDNSESYKGFEGGEAVVSPATGILLEYGVYEGEKPEGSEEEGERLNYDLKYPYAGLTGAGSDTTDDTTGGEPTNQQESQEVYDKVGYAKILVLDLDNYLSLEKSIGTSKFGGSLYDTNKMTFKDKIFDEEEIEDYNENQQMLYAYKEFVEKYESFDLGGYIIYIDGFKCELPNPEKTDDSDDDVPLGNGVELSMDYFKNNASTYEETLYEKDTTYNYTNKEVKKRVDAENKLKYTAKPLYYDSSNDLLYIKEGTVIGRTFSDKEVVEDLRGGTYIDVNEYNANRSEDEEEMEHIITGNYLRIVMRDKEDNVVENVEDYLKLDDDKTDLDTDWVLFYWLPFESGGTDVEGCGPESQGSCSEGETAVGIIQWTVLVSKNMNNIASQFIEGCLDVNPTLCEPLKKYQSWSASDFWNDWKGSKLFQATLSEICDVNRDEFLMVQMEVAKKQYYEPIIEDHPWVESLPTCVQAEILHLRVWGASLSDLDSHQNDSPEQILAYVRHKIANTSSTAGDATGDETTGRAFNEPEIGYGILDGRLSEDDVEEWVRNHDVSVLKENGVEYKGG